MDRTDRGKERRWPYGQLARYLKPNRRQLGEDVKRNLAILAALAVVLTACSGSVTQEATTTTTETTTTTTIKPTTTTTRPRPTTTRPKPTTTTAPKPELT